MPYTRADLEIVYDTAPWGAPLAHATVRGGPWDGHVYRLRSAKGLPDATKGRQWHYHLDRVPAVGKDGRASYDWRGVFPSARLEACIDLLVDELNLWAREENDRWEIADAMREVVNLVGSIEDTLPWRSARTLRERWPEVREAVLHAEMVLFTKTDPGTPGLPPAMPVPPSMPWVAPVAWLGRPTRDGRLLHGWGDYGLRFDSPVTVFQNAAGSHDSTPVGLLTSVERHEDLLWGYGLATPEMAPRLTSGELFVSVELHPHSDALMYATPGEVAGGLIYGAAVLDRSVNPWTSDGSWTQSLEDRDGKEAVGGAAAATA